LIFVKWRQPGRAVTPLSASIKGITSSFSRHLRRVIFKRILSHLRISRPRIWQMAEQQYVFDDGASYERMMGIWSRLAGEIFLDWLAPPSNARWIDIGCGNGAFTELIVARCTPAEVQGIDPSEGQLAFARQRYTAGVAEFRQGGAMSLPFPEDRFDVAIMALVIFFVPEPAKGVAEMARVVGPGGAVAAYAWDIVGGGFPMEPFQAELRAMGHAPPLPPSYEASRIDVMRDLWTGSGLEAVETREITVQRTFADFEDFWTTCLLSPAIRPTVAAMTSGDVELLKPRVRARVPADGAGRVTLSGRANAVKGRVRK
jgi:ubiquinone/menaquinone biosynthesis C-methylase UbiE